MNKGTEKVDTNSSDNFLAKAIISSQLPNPGKRNKKICADFIVKLGFEIHEMCQVIIIIICRDKNSLSIATTLDNMVGRLEEIIVQIEARTKFTGWFEKLQ